NVCVEIFGRDYARKLRELPAGASLPEPGTPRVLNYEAVNKERERFNGLFTKYGLDPRQHIFDDLRAAINRETTTKIIDPAQGGGLRRKVFSEFHAEFVADLQKLTDAENSQVKYIIFEIPGNSLPGFTTEQLTVISPPRSGVKTGKSTATKTVGNVEVDSSASVDGKSAYRFSVSKPLGDTISIYLDREEIDARKNRLLFSILGISALAIGLAIALAFVIGGGITKPLETLMTDIQIISGGNFDHKPLARSADEIGIVSRLLGDMAAGLKAAQEVWLENQGRKHDLDIAKEIQENLLPKHVPRIAGYDVSAYYSPSKEVGGDYYDFFLVDKTHLGMVCADVSGKGIPGSMVMMMCKALVSYEAQDNLSPRDIFCKVNRSLAKDIKRGMFVTAFYMLLDIPTARLTVASAGHNPLLLYRAATKQCTQINPGGIALGFDKDGRLFERNMKEEVIQLQRGDRAVIYTDGVTEAMGPNNEEFGEDRLMAITVQCAAKSSTEYLTTLVNAIQGHAQSDEQHDDITIVTLKVG
ncbi:MAG: SpoIIE family protein phosphatase, partial [Planctomycetes bacterium]|nr:SpoIIE family protein phosphatase [Planctomycetota bacterium]